MIYSRQQFADMWNEEKPGLGEVESPLWIPEHSVGPVKCEWFVCVKPLSAIRTSKELFWDWCEENLKGQCRCFSSDFMRRSEWWGFTHEEDVPIWMLKWM